MTLTQIIELMAIELPGASLDNILALTNRTLRNLARQRAWRFYESEEQFDLEAYYSTGTVDTTEGLVAVTGTDTVWGAGYVGWKIKFSGSSHYYTIATVPLVGSLTLTEAFAEETLADATYQIFQDVYDAPDDFGQLKHIENLDTGLRYNRDDFFMWQGKIQFTQVPSSAAPLLLRYYRVPTRMSGPSSTLDVSNSLADCLVLAVLKSYISRQLPGDQWYNRLREVDSEYKDALRVAKTNDSLEDRTPTRLARNLKV